MTILAATLLTGRGKASLFDLYLYLNAYLWMPVGVTLALAMWVKHSPRWAAWATVVWGAGVSVFLYNIMPLDAVRHMAEPVFGARLYGYMVGNPFAATNFFTIPLTIAFFLATKLFYDPAKHRGYERQVARFFRRMETPVDFEREVGNDNSRAQALVLSRVMSVYALLVSLILLVPNSMEGRVGVAGCAGAMFAIAGGLRCMPGIYRAARGLCNALQNLLRQCVRRRFHETGWRTLHGRKTMGCRGRGDFCCVCRIPAHRACPGARHCTAE